MSTDRSIGADQVVATLERLTAQRCAPGFVRFDNGPEFVVTRSPTGAASTASTRCSSTRVAVAEPMDRVVQRKVPRRAAQRLQFESLLEARVIIEDWRIDYNMNRPHTAHGDLTPTEFAQEWITRNQPVPA